SLRKESHFSAFRLTLQTTEEESCTSLLELLPSFFAQPLSRRRRHRRPWGKALRPQSMQLTPSTRSGATAWARLAIIGTASASARLGSTRTSAFASAATVRITESRHAECEKS